MKKSSKNDVSKVLVVFDSGECVVMECQLCLTLNVLWWNVSGV